MKRLIKKASYYNILHSFRTNDGNIIEFSARILANKLQYSIIIIYQFNNASFYDGNSFEEAFDFYKDIAIAFKGVFLAEQIRKQKQIFLERAKKLLNEVSIDKYKNQHTLYFKKPLFLGISEGC